MVRGGCQQQFERVRGKAFHTFLVLLQAFVPPKKGLNMSLRVLLIIL